MTFTGIATGADLASVDNVTGTTTQFGFYNVSSSSNEANLYLDNSQATVVVDGIETINIESEGNEGVTNVLALNDNSLTSISVIGANNLTMTYGTSAGLISVDANAFTGNLNTALTAAGATLIGGTGDDTLTLGNGGVLTGNDGNDSLTVTTGNSTINGGSGTDTITAGAGSDNIDGGADADTIIAGDGNNTVYGRSGNDSITAGSGNDVIEGNEGDDTIIAGGGSNNVTGGSGADTITGGSGADTITGDEGNDVITAGIGEDNIDGGADDDLIQMGGNLTIADTVIGGTGTNTLTSTAANLQTASGAQLTYVSDIQILTATTALSSLLDVNNIDEAINTINLNVGGTGILQGLNAGATTVNLGAVLTGSLDLVDDAATTTESVSLIKNYADDSDAFASAVITATGVETLSINTGAESVSSTQATSTVYIEGDSTTGAISISVTGANEISLGAVTNTTSSGVFSIDLSGLTAQASGLTATVAAPALTSGTVSITGSAGNDVLNGDANSANTIRGGEGVDSIVGGSAADLLHGNDGADSIWGVSGNDSLIGGAGDDYISVGNTGNTFVAGNVTIDGGEGNDIVNIGNTINVSDSIDGGTGTLDTLSMSVSLISSTTTVTGFEVLQLDAALTQNMALFTSNTGWTQVNATTGANTINNASALVVTAALDNTVDSFVLDRASGVTAGTITVQALQDENTSIATVTANEDTTITVAAGAAVAGRLITIGALDAVAATNINITGVQNTAVTLDTSAADGGLGTSARTVTINASTATGTVVYDGTTGASGIAQVITGSSTAASSLTGGAGNDTITLGNAATGNVVDTKNGTNNVVGGTGADSITGGTGSDTISGNGGSDTINAGAGNDVISDGAGQDTITAGDGADTITLGSDSQADRVVQGTITESIASTSNTLSGAVVAGQTLTFGNSLDIVQNFQASGTGYDVVAVRVAGTPTSLVTAAPTFSSLAANTTYYASGNYNTLTGTFTITANGAGADTLVVQTSGSGTNLSTNASALLLQGVVSSTLSGANFVAQNGITAAYSGTAYTISGNATGLLTMAANGTVSTSTSDDVTTIGTFSQSLVTAIDVSGVTGSFGTSISVEGATSTALASVTGSTGNDTITQATADIGANTSVINGNGGTDTVAFTTFGSATIYGSVGGGRQYITDIDNITLTEGATQLTLDSSVATVVAVTHRTASTTGATVILGTGAAHTYTSASAAIDTVTLGLTGQTATLTNGGTNDVVANSVAGASVITDGTSLAVSDLAGLAGNFATTAGGTATLAGAIDGATTVTLGTIVGFDVLSVDENTGAVVITSGATNSLTSLTVNANTAAVTYKASVAQLDALVVTTSVAGTSTLEATAAAGGTLDLAGMTQTFTNLNLGAVVGNVVVTGTAALVDSFGVIAGVGAGGTTTVTTTNDAALDLTTGTFTLIDTLNFAGAGATDVLTVQYDDLTATNFNVINGAGTSRLVVTTGAANFTNAVISGFDLITTAASTGDVTLASTSIVGAYTLVGDAGSDLVLATSGSYANLTMTSADFDSIALAEGVNATLASTAIVGTSVVAITGANAGVTESVTINAAAATSAINIAHVTTVTDLASITINDNTGANVITSSITDSVRAITTINLANGGSDQVRINNSALVSADTTEAVIQNFTTGSGAGRDQLQTALTTTGTVVFDNGYQSNETVTQATITVLADSVLEVGTGFGQLISTAAPDALALANAAFTKTVAADEAYAVVIYGGGNAYLYQMTLADGGAGADAFTAAELVATIVGVNTNSLEAVNFYA
jgi:Ca2+-binding RTX toxin-like protein